MSKYRPWKPETIALHMFGKVRFIMEREGYTPIVKDDFETSKIAEEADQLVESIIKYVVASINKNPVNKRE